MTHYDQEKFEPVKVDTIEHHPDQVQAEIIAENFAKVSNEYRPIDRTKINVDTFTPQSIPVFNPYQVQKKN